MIPVEITEDLKKGMGLEECLIKHGTNLTTLFKSNYPETINPDSERKHIEEKPSGFYIKKKIDWITYYYGRYATLQDAQMVRDELIRTGWKQDQVDNICHGLGITRIPNKRNNHVYKERVKG